MCLYAAPLPWLNMADLGETTPIKNTLKTDMLGQSAHNDSMTQYTNNG